jgi:hypothetical protein
MLIRYFVEGPGTNTFFKGKKTLILMGRELSHSRGTTQLPPDLTNLKGLKPARTNRLLRVTSEIRRPLTVNRHAHRRFLRDHTQRLPQTGLHLVPALCTGLNAYSSLHGKCGSWNYSNQYTQ